MSRIINIDGSEGEGGGQVLRSSLALSLVTGQPFRIEKIRARRSKPGLMRQHLTAVQAAARIGGAHVQGAEIGSTQLTFEPGAVAAGEYHFAVGTAGSAMLVLQTVLPPLMLQAEPSRVVVEGGTHNSNSPPFDYLEKAFAPLMRTMGVELSLELKAPGFYPAGGGKVVAGVQRVGEAQPLDLMERGEIRQRKARCLIANVLEVVAERELARVAAKMNWTADCLLTERITQSRGPGNVLMIELVSEALTEVFTAFGERDTRSETVADNVIAEAREYLASSAPVGRHLADQLLLPMALGAGGRFRTLSPTQHTLTNIEVIQKFLDVEITCEKEEERIWKIEVRK